MTRYSQISRRTFLGASAGALLAAGTFPLVSASADDTGGGFDADNVRVSRDGFAQHYEPSVAANPRNPRNLLACSRVVSGARHSIATYVSFDRGVTWRSNGALPGTPDAFDANATVTFDAAGRGFVSTIAASSLSFRDVEILVWRSDDGGQTFGSPVAAERGLADHPWMVVGDGERAPLHVVWFGVTGLEYSRSSDGGASFEPVRTIPGTDPGIVGWPSMAAGPDGAVHVVYVGRRPTGTGPVPPVLVVSSLDDGATFSAPVEIWAQIALPPPLPGGPAIHKESPMIAASLRDGSVYAAQLQIQPGAYHTDVVVARSRDRGRTWSDRVAVFGGQALRFQPKLAVDREGSVWVSAYSFGPSGVDVVLSRMQSRALQFSPAQTVTSRPFDVTLGVPGGGSFNLGDYQGLTTSDNAVHPFWTDTRTGQMEIFTATIHGN